MTGSLPSCTEPSAETAASWKQSRWLRDADEPAGRGFSESAGNPSPTCTAPLGTCLKTLETETEAHALPALRGFSTEKGDGRFARADTPACLSTCDSHTCRSRVCRGGAGLYNAHLLKFRTLSPGGGGRVRLPAAGLWGPTLRTGAWHC